VPSPAPKNWFLGAGHAVTRPYRLNKKIAGAVTGALSRHSPTPVKGIGARSISGGGGELGNLKL